MTYYWEWTASRAFVVIYVLFAADELAAGLPAPASECLSTTADLGSGPTSWTPYASTGPRTELSALCPVRMPRSFDGQSAAARAGFGACSAPHAAVACGVRRPFCPELRRAAPCERARAIPPTVTYPRYKRGLVGAQGQRDQSIRCTNPLTRAPTRPARRGGIEWAPFAGD